MNKRNLFRRKKSGSSHFTIFSPYIAVSMSARFAFLYWWAQSRDLIEINFFLSLSDIPIKTHINSSTEGSALSMKKQGGLSWESTFLKFSRPAQIPR